MPTPTLRPASLDEPSVARLRAMEEELGSVLIAYQAESPFTPLDDEQLRRLRALEQELGVVLLAYRPNVAAVGE